MIMGGILKVMSCQIVMTTQNHVSFKICPKNRLKDKDENAQE